MGVQHQHTVMGVGGFRGTVVPEPTGFNKSLQGTDSVAFSTRWRVIKELASHRGVRFSAVPWPPGASTTLALPPGREVPR